MAVAVALILALLRRDRDRRRLGRGRRRVADRSLDMGRPVRVAGAGPRLALRHPALIIGLRGLRPPDLFLVPGEVLLILRLGRLVAPARRLGVADLLVVALLGRIAILLRGG